MELQELPREFTVCRVASFADAAPALEEEFSFFAKTDDELSLVCPSDCAPQETLAREDGWKGWKISGVLDFSLVGILSGIASHLAENGIPIYAISTYNTDYIFVKRDYFSPAKTVLTQAGYDVRPLTSR